MGFIERYYEKKYNYKGKPYFEDFEEFERWHQANIEKMLYGFLIVFVVIIVTFSIIAIKGGIH